MSNSTTRQVDLVIVGAGFAGLYQLHRARGLGLKTQVLEAGDGVGGTWFWNRYPGARCDVESLDYSYSFSDELQQEWNWSERYAPQPEILRYINHVADRFDLRKDIQFNSRVKSATFDESRVRWTVETEAGEKFDAQYLIMATGCLSIPQQPAFKGLETFKGDWYHSANWPREGVDFAGKRVGLIGTGSSGVQMTPVIAEQAAHLTVFQRTANFSVPAQNEPLTEATLAHVKAHYAERRALAREAVTGVFLSANDKSALEVSDEDRLKEFEFRWRGAGGGFRMLRAFNDLLRNPIANQYAGDFVRGKIRATVKDPAKAEILCPKPDLPFGTKRMCVDTHYYETFNRDNVDLVDVKAHPITEITPTGLRTTQGHHELDVIVFATGFDAMTGALLAMDIRGTGGQSLREKWAEGPRTYLGVSIAGFPNLFTITGPASPGVLANVIYSIDQHVDWSCRAIEHMRSTGATTIDTTPEAEAEWNAHAMDTVKNQLRIHDENNWYMGTNVPGKPRSVLVYQGGLGFYRDRCNEIAEDNYRGFVFGREKAAAEA